jgi:hypothetical protein
MAQLDVFVSHLHVESKFADVLREHLDRDFIGLLKLFISTDSTSIPVGTQWFDVLMGGLRSARLQFILCSPESIKRSWIHYEAGATRVRGIEVVPLCHSGMNPEHLPVPLGMSQGLCLNDPSGLRMLYEKISTMLGSNVPDIDFRALGKRFEALETEYVAQMGTDASAGLKPSHESIVKDPQVLCISSQQYLQLGFKNQLEVVLEAFPKDLRHDRVLSSVELQRVVDQQHRVDIVHIAAFVCPRSGTLYFSDVALPSGTSNHGDAGPDSISAEALAMLFKDAGVRLVVIASGDSLALATTLLPITNVVAPRDIVTSDAMAKWVKTFYATLKTRSLSDACLYAGLASGASMKLLSQQVAAIIQMTWRDEVSPIFTKLN